VKRLVLIAALALFAVAPQVANAADVEVAITAPTDGTHSLSGVVPVTVTASALQGIYNVQLEVDGAPYGAPDFSPSAPYTYAIDWDTTGLTPGNHTLTAVATDWSSATGGVQQRSNPVTVDVGPAYPTVSLTFPKAWTFAHATTQLASSVTDGVAPVTAAYAVDGTSLASPAWDTTQVPDGAHTVTVTATDARGKSATDSVPVTVDNTPPTTTLLSPTANHYFTDAVPASANASDAYGIASVQYLIDGKPAGAPITTPDTAGGYTYSQTLSLTGLAPGAHTVTDVATDGAGNTTTSSPVSFTVGAAPVAATLTSPLDWTFAAKTVTVAAGVSGGAAPYSARLYVDGVATGAPDTSAPYSFAWDTTKVADGAHTVKVVVTDSSNATATTAGAHQTVDNTAPQATMYKPTAGARYTGTTTFQVFASDVNGVGSVQFTIDGKPVGQLLRTPDAGQQYLYSLNVDTSTLAPGQHVVSAVVADGAGNVTSAAPVSITTGAYQYLPVLNYHGIDSVSSDNVNISPADADQQLAYLKTNGYQSVTLEQYQQWTSGQDIGVAKPVLITVDDGLPDELAWDALLKKYDFKAVLFVVTGFADNTTPGDTDPRDHMSWSTIQSLAANGRWQIAFHAGDYGHGEYESGVRIGQQSYPADCMYFYTCLSQRTTGGGKNQKTIVESFDDYRTAVTNELNAGIAKLKSRVPSASFAAWAAPFNDAGQWTNLYNDPTGQVQNWLPAYMASRFPISFMETNPITYGQASGLVGGLTAYGRHYRYEVDRGTPIAQFSAALTDTAFTR
jgi:hypothetical protein